MPPMAAIGRDRRQDAGATAPAADALEALHFAPHFSAEPARLSLLPKFPIVRLVGGTARWFVARRAAGPQ